MIRVASKVIYRVSYEGGITMYLDPGFGSMVVQIIIAGAAVVGTYLFIVRDKLKSLLFKNKSKASEPTEHKTLD